jgi:hypothetical protein
LEDAPVYSHIVLPKQRDPCAFRLRRLDQHIIYTYGEGGADGGGREGWGKGRGQREIYIYIDFSAMQDKD